jgi:hypothetical protein
MANGRKAVRHAVFVVRVGDVLDRVQHLVQHGVGGLAGAEEVSTRPLSHACAFAVANKRGLRTTRG